MGENSKFLNLVEFGVRAPKISTGYSWNALRITKVGSFIRGCRLDEISQLLNILTGDMTFVGTRPEVKKYVGIYYTNEMMATLLLPAGFCKYLL